MNVKFDIIKGEPDNEDYCELYSTELLVSKIKTDLPKIKQEFAGYLDENNASILIKKEVSYTAGPEHDHNYAQPHENSFLHPKLKPSSTNRSKYSFSRAQINRRSQRSRKNQHNSTKCTCCTNSNVRSNRHPNITTKSASKNKLTKTKHVPEAKAVKKPHKKPKTKLLKQEKPCRFKCKECTFSAPDLNLLSKHKYYHVGQKLQNCGLCTYTSCYTGLRRRHIMNVHINGTVFKCAQCEYATTVRASLKKHMLTHKQPKNLKCDECKFSTSYEASMTRHKRTHAMTVEKRFVCEKCTFTTMIEKDYITHLQSHPNVLTYKCPTCEFATANKEYLSAHTKTHLKMDEVYVFCIGCKMNFLSKICDGISEKLQKCEVCTYLETNLEISVKQYHCPHCNFIASNKSVLAKHSIKHRKQLPEEYALCKCGRYFPVKGVKDKKSSQCEFCQYFEKRNTRLLLEKNQSLASLM